MAGRKMKTAGCGNAGMERLTEYERGFAAEHHGLIYSFLNRRRLDVNEYYDVVIFGYLKAVMNYNRKEQLQKYSFATIAWRTMRSSLSNDRNAKCRHAVTVSMDKEITESGETLLDFLMGREPDEAVEYIKMIAQELPAEQRKHFHYMYLGYSTNEIKKMMGISCRRAYTDRKRIEATAARVAGEYMLHRWEEPQRSPAVAEKKAKTKQ